MHEPVIPCAGGIVFDDARRLLVVKRAHEPDTGSWSIPGGRCLPGELLTTACIREVYEETGLIVAITATAGTVRRPAPGGRAFDITDFVCVPTGGTLKAASDAAAAQWVDRAGLSDLRTVPGLVDTLLRWGQLPA